MAFYTKSEWILFTFFFIFNKKFGKNGKMKSRRIENGKVLIIYPANNYENQMIGLWISNNFCIASCYSTEIKI